MRRITITANYDFCLLLTNTSGFLLDKSTQYNFTESIFFTTKTLRPTPVPGSQSVEWHLKVPHAVIKLKVTYLHYQVSLTSQTKTAESSHARWTSLKIDKAQMSSTAATLHFFLQPTTTDCTTHFKGSTTFAHVTVRKESHVPTLDV